MRNYENQLRRSVYYYQLIRENKVNSIGESIHGWHEAFKKFFNSRKNIVNIGKVSYQLHKNAENLIILTMHKKIDLTFANKKDENNGKFTDIEPGEQDSQRLAHASVAVIGEINNKLYVAITKGGHSGSPAKAAFTSLLIDALKLPSGWGWQVSGVMNKSDHEKLKASNGITMLEGSFVAHASKGEIEGIGYASPMEEYAKYIADYVNTDVEIKVTINLKDKGYEHTSKARDLALQTQFDTSNGKKPRVRAQTLSGEEILTLVEHNFASEVILDINDIIGVKFSALIDKSVKDFKVNAQELLQRDI